MAMRIFRVDAVLALATLLHSLGSHPLALPVHHGHDILTRQLNPALLSTTLPSYVIDYAPYLYLGKDEQWWPTDVADFFNNVLPFVNFQDTGAPNVSFVELPTFSEQVYLTSIDNIADNPGWLYNVQGMPNSTTGYSQAPATIIVVPKNNETVDAFYFFFYAFNQGREILDLLSFGNHVGDWEHVMVRFYNGSPQYIFLSQHSNGVAYPYSALMPTGKRATVYVAEGDHAHYATPGLHIYDDVLVDSTSAGTPYDPTLNYRAYTLDLANNTWIFNANYNAELGSSANPETAAAGSSRSASLPTVDRGEIASSVMTIQESARPLDAEESGAWLFFEGNWGDQQYPTSNPIQTCIFGHCKYTGGPSGEPLTSYAFCAAWQGPYMKNLGRYTVCFDESDCTIRDSIFDD